MCLPIVASVTEQLCIVNLTYTNFSISWSIDLANCLELVMHMCALCYVFILQPQCGMCGVGGSTITMVRWSLHAEYEGLLKA